MKKGFHHSNILKAIWIFIKSCLYAQIWGSECNFDILGSQTQLEIQNRILRKSFIIIHCYICIYKMN